MPPPRRLPPDGPERLSTVVEYMTPGALRGISRIIQPVNANRHASSRSKGPARILGDVGTAFMWHPWTITATGAQTRTLAFVPKPKSEHVYLNGIAQREGTDWTRTELTLNILDAMGVAVGDVLEIRYAYSPALPLPPVLGEWIQDADIVVPATVLTQMLHTKGVASGTMSIAAAHAAVRAAPGGSGNTGTPVTVYHHPSSSLFLIETRAETDGADALSRMGWLMTFTNEADMPPPVPPTSPPPGYVLEYESTAGTPLTDVTYTGGNITGGSADYPLEALAVPGTYGPSHYLTSAEAAGLTVKQTFATSSSNVPLNVTVPWVDGGASLMLVHQPWRLGTSWGPGPLSFGQYNLRIAITRGAWTYRPTRYRYVPE